MAPVAPRAQRKQIAFITTDETADDGTQDATSTTCMTNGTTAEDCDEIKEGTLILKITLDIDPVALITFAIQFFLNGYHQQQCQQ